MAGVRDSLKGFTADSEDAGFVRNVEIKIFAHRRCRFQSDS